MTTVSLRFDDEMKRQLDEMCDEMGMNLTTFFMIYAKKALRDRRIPFEVTAPDLMVFAYHKAVFIPFRIRKADVLGAAKQIHADIRADIDIFAVYYLAF